jgi:hypothetical protein
MRKIFLTRRFFNLFVGGLVFQRSSDFFRKRLSLCFFLRQVPQEYTPKAICSETNWLQRRCFPEGSAKCSSRRIRIAEQENFLCLVPVEENFFFLFFSLALRMLKLAIWRSRWRWYYLVRWNAELHSPKLSVLLKSRRREKKTFDVDEE